jgi:acyl-CoA reductase-like NAD-dependent aldehyde dehydrogenase
MRGHRGTFLVDLAHFLRKVLGMAKAKVAELQANALRSFNPRTGELVTEMVGATPEDVRAAVRRARAAQPAWASRGAEGRAEALLRVAHEIHARMDDFVDTISAETGKPHVESLSHDVVPTLLTIRYLARIAPKALRPETVGRLIAPTLGFSSKIEWRPFGVVGCISPWNYPFLLAFISVVPALLAGNTVVLKPSEVTPGTGELMRAVLASLPDDVAAVVQGAGEVGAALVDAPCDKICFIGSTATGRRIAAAAAEHLTPLVLELGGQDAAIVCDDADLDTASSGVLWGSFLNAGQTCAAIERTYVVESIADRFQERLLAKLRQVEAEPEPQIGPLCISRQLETVERHVQDAVDRGATLLAGGPEKVRPNQNGSLWYPPTVIAGRSEQMAIFTEETFGPVLPIVRVKDEEEAIRLANAEGYNLTASIWTTDNVKGRAIGSRIKAGTISINDQAASAGAPWGAWGGVGESGYGRLHGKLGIREFTVPVHVGTTILPRMKKVWWYPYDQPTLDTFRAFADFLGAERLGVRLRALASAAPKAIRAIRGKI